MPTDVLDSNPAPSVGYLKVNDARLRYLTPEEVARLLDAAAQDVAGWLSTSC